MSAPITWTLRRIGGTPINLAVEWNSVSIRRPREEGRFSVLNRQNDVITVGSRKGAEITLPVLLMTQAEWLALDEMLGVGETLLLSNTIGENWYVWPVAPHEMQMVPTGDQTARPVRRMTLNFIEQDAP
jgi:hypothetical protein